MLSRRISPVSKRSRLMYGLPACSRTRGMAMRFSGTWMLSMPKQDDLHFIVEHGYSVFMRRMSWDIDDRKRDIADAMLGTLTHEEIIPSHGFLSAPDRG